MEGRKEGRKEGSSATDCVRDVTDGRREKEERGGKNKR